MTLVSRWTCSLVLSRSAGDETLDFTEGAEDRLFSAASRSVRLSSRMLVNVANLPWDIPDLGIGVTQRGGPTFAGF